MDTRKPDVLIAGAGPAGLVLAAVLAELGVGFRIVDPKPGPVPESRAAILHVRTLELLDRLGLAERAIAQGIRTTDVEIFERGRRAGRLPLVGKGAEASTPFPYALGLEQSHTERLLVDWLAERGRRVEWNTRLVGLTSVRRDGGVEEPVAARWIVGADGARSAVRQALGIGFSGHTYPQTGLLADVDLDLPAGDGLPDGTLRLNLTRGGFVGLFRLTSGRYRLFGAVPPGFAPADSGSDVSHEAYAGVPVADIQRWFDSYFGVTARITGATWTALFRIHSRIADRFRAGDVFLIGDAAHIHSPAGGQGMNLAIGDAFNLGWKLALVARGEAHPRLLDSYEAERRPVAETVLRWADRGFALETTRNPVAAWAREHLASRLVGPLTRIPAVRARIFRLFAQTWIQYRHSPAVAGEHAGERAVESPPDLRHHVVVSGGDRPDIEDLLGRYAIDVRIHHRDAREPRLLLIRPDGHIGYAGPPDLQRLAGYLDRFYLQ